MYMEGFIWGKIPHKRILERPKCLFPNVLGTKSWGKKYIFVETQNQSKGT